MEALDSRKDRINKLIYVRHSTRPWAVTGPAASGLCKRRLKLVHRIKHVITYFVEDCQNTFRTAAFYIGVGPFPRVIF